MRRFIMGLICGLALSGASIAVAAVSNEVKTSLFPTSLHVYIDGEDKTGTEEVSVLKYDGRLYVPLRVFAEKMGSTVDYNPESGGQWATVNVYKVDDRDLNVRDSGGYVGIGHTDVQFAKSPTSRDSVSSVKGAIKFYKTIPKGKQVVLDILNKDNRPVAVTEPILLPYHKVSDMAAGEAATFTTRFPYMDPVEGYKLQARIVDETSWTYQQVEGFLTGAGGMMGNPLGLSIGAEHEVKKGEPVQLSVNIVNFSNSDTIVLSQPISFDIQIYSSDTQKVVRTLRTAPLTGTLYWGQGGAFTKLVWDQKDDRGNMVPAGEYVAGIDLPKAAAGATVNDPETKQEYTIESSLKTMFPIVIQ